MFIKRKCSNFYHKSAVLALKGLKKTTIIEKKKVVEEPKIKELSEDFVQKKSYRKKTGEELK